RDAATLAAFDAVALVGALALAAASLQGELVATWYPLDFIRGVVTASAASIVGGFQLLLGDIQWHELPQDDRLRNVRRALLGVAGLVRNGTAPQLRVFRQLSGLLLVLLAVIMASALQRMRLYVAAFGLSTDRLYATSFMILLLGVLAWFAWTVLRGQRQKFVFGSLMQGLAVLAGLHVLNPDAFIINTNLNRPAAERPFDAKYAPTLGGDAVPSLLAALPQLG